MSLLSEYIWHANDIIEMAIAAHKEKYEFIMKGYLEKIRITLRKEVESELVKIEGKQDLYHRISDIIQETVDNVLNNFEERRKQIAQDYAVPAARRAIEQHFVFKSDNDLDFHHSTIACEICQEDPTVDMFPHENIFNILVEGILFCVDKNDITNFEKVNCAAKAAAFLIHTWLDLSTTSCSVTLTL